MCGFSTSRCLFLRMPFPQRCNKIVPTPLTKNAVSKKNHTLKIDNVLSTLINVLPSRMADDISFQTSFESRTHNHVMLKMLNLWKSTFLHNLMFINYCFPDMFFFCFFFCWNIFLPMVRRRMVAQKR